MRDYYSVLGISIDATDEDIRLAYRKAALKWHPDRNYGNIEEATREFSEAQSAYEVLGDANERAWYDRHKDSILRGADADQTYEEDLNSLTTQQLMPYFGSVSSAALDDSSKGFFTIIRKLFDTLIAEELEACAQQDIDAPSMPSFGGSQSDDHSVERFYAFWSTFNSNKSFSWAEQFAYHRAPDRRVRRAMEKENAKARQNERKDFNDTVHKLVSHMKKRDYRFIAKSQLTPAQRQQELLDARKMQSQASRAANQADLAEFSEQDWQKVDQRQLAEDEMQAFEEWKMEIECVACGKTFKSEKQYASHEKSKKHLQTVKRLRWEMKKEALALGLEYDSDESFATASEGDNDADQVGQEDSKANEDDDDLKKLKEKYSSDARVSKPTSLASSFISGEETDDEYATRAEVEARLTAEIDGISLKDSKEASQTSLNSSSKKKQKQKKAQKQKKNRG